MKKIYLANILIFLSAFATSLAADNPPAAKPVTGTVAPNSANAPGAAPATPPAAPGMSVDTASQMDNDISAGSGNGGSQPMSASDKAAVDAVMSQIMQQAGQQTGQKVDAPPATTTTTSTPTSTTTTSTATVTTTTATTDTTIDPTLAFFFALSTCAPGDYTEKNIITTEVGPPMLNQQIIGLSDDQLTCNVKLMTPDNRSMDCAFPMTDLSSFSDQHFLQGMLQDTVDSPDPDSLNADLRWSQMKSDNCGLSY